MENIKKILVTLFICASLSLSLNTKVYCDNADVDSSTAAETIEQPTQNTTPKETAPQNVFDDLEDDTEEE